MTTQNGIEKGGMAVKFEMGMLWYAPFLITPLCGLE
jgi:hypothetical protein